MKIQTIILALLLMVTTTLGVRDFVSQDAEATSEKTQCAPSEVFRVSDRTCYSLQGE